MDKNRQIQLSEPVQRGINIIFIFLFAILATFLIGFGIINMIDKKISNVAVNIPPIKITQPNLTLRVSKEDADKINLCACDNKNKELEFNYDDSQNNNTVEHFGAVKSDYVNIVQSQKPQLYDIKGYNYMDYANVPGPLNVNQMRILNKNMRGLAPEHVRKINIPEGWNFAFPNI